MAEHEKHRPLAEFWIYQTEILTVSAKILIGVALGGTVLNSLWFLWDDFERIFLQNLAILSGVGVGWICLWLIRRGFVRAAIRFFLSMGYVVSAFMVWSSKETFVLGGMFFLAMFVLISMFTLPLREPIAWGLGGIFLGWVVLSLRYFVPVFQLQDNLPDLVGMAIVTALVLGVIMLLSHTIVHKLNAALAQTRLTEQSLKEQVKDLRHAELAQQASEKKYRTIFKASPDFIYLTDLQGNLLEANPALLNTIELSPDTLQTMSVFDATPGPASEKLLEVIEALRQGQSLCGIEMQAIVAGGEVRTYEIHSVPLYEAGQLTQVLNIARDITERIHVEALLKKRLAYEHLLSKVSTASVKIKDIESFQVECINQLAETLDVSRIYISKHDHATDTVSNTAEWTAEGVTSQKDKPQNIPAAETPWWTDMMQANRIIKYNNIEAMPVAAESEKEMLHAQNIKAILGVPLFVGETYYGFMGFDECETHREWELEDVQTVGAVSKIMTGVMERVQSERALRESEAGYRSLVELTRDIIVMHNAEHRVMYINQAGLDILGANQVDVIDHLLSDFEPLQHLTGPINRFKADEYSGDQPTIQRYDVEITTHAGRRLHLNVNKRHPGFNRWVVRPNTNRSPRYYSTAGDGKPVTSI